MLNITEADVLMDSASLRTTNTTVELVTERYICTMVHEIQYNAHFWICKVTNIPFIIDDSVDVSQRSIRWVPKYLTLSSAGLDDVFSFILL